MNAIYFTLLYRSKSNNSFHTDSKKSANQQSSLGNRRLFWLMAEKATCHRKAKSFILIPLVICTYHDVFRGPLLYDLVKPFSDTGNWSIDAFKGRQKNTSQVYTKDR